MGEPLLLRGTKVSCSNYTVRTRKMASVRGLGHATLPCPVFLHAQACATERPRVLNCATRQRRVPERSLSKITRSQSPCQQHRVRWTAHRSPAICRWHSCSTVSSRNRPAARPSSPVWPASRQLMGKHGTMGGKSHYSRAVRWDKIRGTRGTRLRVAGTPDLVSPYLDFSCRPGQPLRSRSRWSSRAAFPTRMLTAVTKTSKPSPKASTPVMKVAVRNSLRLKGPGSL